jgi:hypothetical protein
LTTKLSKHQGPKCKITSTLFTFFTRNKKETAAFTPALKTESTGPHGILREDKTRKKQLERGGRQKKRKEKEKEWTCGSLWFLQKENRGDERTGGEETKKNHRFRGETEPGGKGKRKTGLLETERKKKPEGKEENRGDKTGDQFQPSLHHLQQLFSLQEPRQEKNPRRLD